MNGSHGAHPQHGGSDPDRGGSTGGATHLDLLEHARTLQQAALEHDADAVHDHLCRLREALVGHMQAEQDAFGGLSPAAAEVVGTGQRQLIERIDELIGVASGGHPECRCIEGTSRMISLLRRQARLESGLRA